MSSDPDRISRDVLEHATGRQGSLILGTLVDGNLPVRRSPTRRRVSEPDARADPYRLESDGLVSRTPYSKIPPRLGYDLTDSAADPAQGPCTSPCGGGAC